ncbi:hypothetical protein FHT09_002639 [Xanthomonas arboricola]|nr:hypothetical protein [Xanthomonas sp. CFBP 8152]
MHRKSGLCISIQQRASNTALRCVHQPSRLVLARPPSRDLTRHGCRVRAYKDVLAACPAMVGGQGPRSQAADQPLCSRSIRAVQTFGARRPKQSGLQTVAAFNRNQMLKSKARLVECAVPSPLAGHAVNPSMEAPWRHPCRQGSRNRQGHRTRKLVGCFVEDLLCGLRWTDFRTHDAPNNAHQALLLPCTPTISTGPCLPTVAGPYAAWMPRKSLQGRTCGVSCDGGRARAPLPSRRSTIKAR